MLYQSPAGSILSLVVHSLLIMPPDIVKPLLPSFLALLPSIEKLNQVLPAAALLEEQELEWPVKGKKRNDDHCNNDNPNDDDDDDDNNTNSNSNSNSNRSVLMTCSNDV